MDDLLGRRVLGGVGVRRVWEWGKARFVFVVYIHVIEAGEQKSLSTDLTRSNTG